MDNLSGALEKLKLVSTDSATDNVESCLDCMLKALANNNTEASLKIQEMGILPLLPALLRPQSSCTPKVANIIAELAKNEFMRSPCVEAGLIPPLAQLLNSSNQEVLLQTGRALGNICYDSRTSFNVNEWWLSHRPLPDVGACHHSLPTASTNLLPTMYL
uniref:Rap1 GTPase-GDP dissociation stimulator 1 n=1 Tax=Gasterosteus aculeatus aculeatus TaxID=481459 RepID=A0AAQ4QL96_GASAC